MRKQTVWISDTKSDTHYAIQPQKQARSSKFRIKEEEGLYCVAKTKTLISLSAALFLQMHVVGFLMQRLI